MRRIRKARNGGLSLVAGLLALSACTSDAGTRPLDEGSTVLPPGNQIPNQNPLGTAGSTSLPMGAGNGAVVPNPGNNQVSSPSGQAMPCDVSAAVKTNCQTCHGTQLLGGAPMALLTYDDFHRDYVVKTSKDLIGQTKKVYELAALRLQNALNPMPPSGSFTVPEDKPGLLAWLQGGAIAAGADDSCMPAMNNGGATAEGGSGSPTMQPGDYDFEPPAPTLPGEQCFELLMHGGSSPGDTSPYTVEAREYYEQFYFKVPWPAGWVGTKSGGRYDALQVLHHWLLFTTSTHGLDTDGTHEEVIGTQIGDTAQLIQGWAIGGATITMPEGVGFELPPPNTMLNVQWHYYNTTGQPQQDNTAVILCAVPKENLPNIASMTWLGTENINVPAGQIADAHGSCINDSGAPIHIIQFVPHMHKIGINMKSEVMRAGGGMMETVFDKPFSNTSQLQYMTDVTLQPNDTIVSTCTYQNMGNGTVGFGTSTDQEMCYQFAVSYPAHALENGVFSLIGATNVCWQLGE